jgi:RNA polymerase sigma factor (sigma-70 family)
VKASVARPPVRTAATRADLVERARAGDHDAFAVLVTEALPRVYGAARLILRDPHRAEDAAQEALVLAWRHIAALRDPAAWDAWLYRLTVRACYRLGRSAGARHVTELDVRADREPAGLDFTRAVAERERVLAALGELGVDQRAVVVLHFYLDLPLTQAAVVLGIPAGTAKSRLHRALETLRSTLGADPDDVAMVVRETTT